MTILFAVVAVVLWLGLVLLIAAVCGISDETPRFPKHRPRTNVRLVRDEKDDAA